MKKVHDRLLENFRTWFESTGACKAVIGISGGVDSAVCAKIATESLGQEKVLGLLLPHRDFSSRANLQDARELCQDLQVDFQEIEIAPLCAPFFALDFAGSDFVRANLMARVRANVLFAAANAENGIVVGTCNRSEIEIGFFTKFGDGAADCEILGKLLKTQVFALARNLGLEKFANKRPTAEIFPGHFDENELGVKYSQIDAALQKMAQGNFVPQSESERKVQDLHQRSAHKRQMPVIISSDSRQSSDFGNQISDFSS